MLFTRNLLNTYLQLKDTNNNIANQLTLKSCEIEGIQERIIPKQVVIGLVKSIEKHPKADKLVICKLDCGTHGIVQICTAAENMIIDYYVPVALPGAFLPKLGFEIGEREMRGVASNGMICAKEELGIQEDTNIHGIWNMQALEGNETDDFHDITEEDLGKPITDKYPRLNNAIFDVDNKTLTHRPDMTSHLGIARELQAIYQTHNPDKIITSNFPKQMKEIQTEKITGRCNAHVQSPHVRYYSLIDIPNIEINRSNFQTRGELIDLDITPRNNRVDFSNLFMYMTSQPVHFFDSDKIEGDITVRQAKPGEIFIDLFEKRHTLTDQDIVITDQNKILALAGIIGANNSGIDENTKNIVVEIANFDPIITRRTATRLGLRTDAIMRFEKNINPLFSSRATTYFIQLINNKHKEDYYIPITHTPAICTSIYHATEHQQQTINISRPYINKIIRGENHLYGTKIGNKILTSLGCIINTTEDNDIQNIAIPYRRSPKDLTIPSDIAEEVVRIYGYEKIDTKPIAMNMSETPNTASVDMQQRIEDIITKQHRCDFVETYPRANINTMKIFDTDTTNLVELENALSPETTFMAPNLIFNLLDTVKKNHKFFDTLRIATTGDVYSKASTQQGNKTKNNFTIIGNINPNNDIQESKHLGIMLYHKSQTKDRVDDLTLQTKSIIQSIGKSFLYTDTLNYVPTDRIFFHPKQQADIYYRDENDKQSVGVKIGFIGKLHPTILNQCKLPENSQLVYAYIDLPTLSQLHILSKEKSTSGTYQTLQDQIITRDISFVIDRDQTFEEVIHSVQETTGVGSVDIFDIYQGSNLPDNKKSIALQITINGDGKMKTEEINHIMEQSIINAQKTGAILRKNFSE